MLMFCDSGPELYIIGSRPVCLDRSSACVSRALGPAVKAVTIFGPLLYVNTAISSYGVNAPCSAPRELFTFAILSKVMLWSITSATDKGNASVVNSANCCRRLFSYTRTSRHVSPATGLPLLSFTVNGISTKFTPVWITYSGPCPCGGISGCFPSSIFCAAVSGNLLGTAFSCDVELVSPFESAVVPRPGVTGPAGSICGLGASGICGFGPSGICCCCVALCCARSSAGCPSPGCPSNAHTKAPANTLLLTTRIPHTFQSGYRDPAQSIYQTTSAPSLPPSPTSNARSSLFPLDAPPSLNVAPRLIPPGRIFL